MENFYLFSRKNIFVFHNFNAIYIRILFSIVLEEHRALVIVIVGVAFSL